MNRKTWTLAMVAVALVSLSCLETVQAQSSNTDWGGIEFALPSTPRPEDVNCYVEVRTTRQLGGRCVRMGMMYSCQAGEYLASNPGCQRIMNRGRSRPMSRRG